MRRCLPLCLLGVLLVALASSGAGKLSGKWQDADANLTMGEFLQFYFQVNMSQHASATGMSGNIIQFIPGDDPGHAILLIHQTWNDDFAPNELRRHIRQFSSALKDNFESHTKTPVVRGRWQVDDAATHLIIRHTRAKDAAENVAVTINGETLFDDDSFRRAEAAVRQQHGAWLR
jgi:hypothetical protein